MGFFPIGFWNAFTAFWIWVILNWLSALVTARIRSLREGNIFSSVCLLLDFKLVHLGSSPAPSPPGPVGKSALGLRLKGLLVFWCYSIVIMIHVLCRISTHHNTSRLHGFSHIPLFWKCHNIIAWTGDTFISNFRSFNSISMFIWPEKNEKWKMNLFKKKLPVKDAFKQSCFAHNAIHKAKRAPHPTHPPPPPPPVEAVKPLTLWTSRSVADSGFPVLRGLLRGVNANFSQNPEKFRKLHDFFWSTRDKGVPHTPIVFFFLNQAQRDLFQKFLIFFQFPRSGSEKTLSPFMKYSVINRFCRFPS